MSAPRPDRAVIAAYVSELAHHLVQAVPDAVGIVWKGSTFRAWDGPYDFLPGLSDIDVHLYRRGALADPWQLRSDVLGRLGPAPFSAPLQLLVMDVGTLPSWWTLLPGTYGVVAGEDPRIPVPDVQSMLARDRFGLARAAAEAQRVGSEGIGLFDSEVWPYLRAARALFPPVVARVVSVASGDPAGAWRSNRTTLLRRLHVIDGAAGVADAATAYFEAALRAGAQPHRPADAVAALRSGQELLRAAAKWFQARPDAVADRRTSPEAASA